MGHPSVAGDPDGDVDMLDHRKMATLDDAPDEILGAPRGDPILAGDASAIVDFTRKGAA